MNQAVLPATGRISQNLRNALRWWVEELRAAFAPQIARWFADEATVTDLATGGADLRAADGKLLALVPGDGEATLRAMPPAWKGRVVRLTLDSTLVLQKRISYPQAAEENLQDTAAFDLDRQTPFTADQVYFHARVVGRDAARASIEVELTVVARSTLREVMQALRAGGNRLLAIGVAGDRGSPRIDLLPVAERAPRRLTQAQKTNLVLLASVVLLGLFALWIPVLQKREAVKALIPEVQKAETEAEASRRVESEYTRLAQQYNFLTGKKYATYTALEVVEELSKLTPDTAWLSILEIKSNAKARVVQLQGEAASASKMIEFLEQSPLLQNATQSNITTRGQQPNTERFSIATEVKPRPAPAAVPADAAPPAPNPVSAPAAVPVAGATSAPVVAPAPIAATVAAPVATGAPTAPITTPATDKPRPVPAAKTP
ncbi:MAG: PilN domain-containing protein [Betaproteobacteria bacterium]|nr:PilN domain-containing protein [Betaproteobacteria bacterium]